MNNKHVQNSVSALDEHHSDCVHDRLPGHLRYVPLRRHEGCLVRGVLQGQPGSALTDGPGRPGKPERGSHHQVQRPDCSRSRR